MRYINISLCRASAAEHTNWKDFANFGYFPRAEIMAWVLCDDGVSESHRRAAVVAVFKWFYVIGILIALTYGLIYIQGYGMVYKGHFVIYLAVYLETAIIQIGMLVLLQKAINQKSFPKSRLWVILLFVLFAALLVVFIVHATTSERWAAIDSVLLIMIFFEMVSLNIIYNFMAEVSNCGSSLARTAEQNNLSTVL